MSHSKRHVPHWWGARLINLSSASWSRGTRLIEEASPPGQEWLILLFACCIYFVYFQYIFGIFAYFQVCMFSIFTCFISISSWHDFMYLLYICYGFCMMLIVICCCMFILCMILLFLYHISEDVIFIYILVYYLNPCLCLLLSS